MRPRWFTFVLLTAVGLVAGSWLLAEAPAPSRLRRPVAAVLFDAGQTLCVANARSGTVSLLDIDKGNVRAEIAVGLGLSDLALLADGKHLLATDDKAHELIVLTYDATGLSVRSRQPI